VGPAPDASSDAPDGGALDAAVDATRDVTTPDVGSEDVGAADTSASDSGRGDVGGVDADLDAEQADVDSKDGLSPCEVGDFLITCPRETELMFTGNLGLDPRDVHWQNPQGTPPADGWPVAILFQGSLFSPEYGWGAVAGTPFGAYYQAEVIHELLDAGFAVLTPEARFGGSTFWDTNIPPYSLSWTLSGDHEFMLDLFDELDAGTFGPVDTSRMYATGISSGGYMTSRMADAYPGRFRALAIQSASYAWCSGPACTIPTLPEDHPPTLFLHGSLDLTVPLYTMDLYHDDLVDDGVEVRRVVDPNAGHEWLPAAPDEVADWFLTH
jgi:pimeloyl-ACP methyl ester carboxylesterase